MCIGLVSFTSRVGYSKAVCSSTHKVHTGSTTSTTYPYSQAVAWTILPLNHLLLALMQREILNWLVRKPFRKIPSSGVSSCITLEAWDTSHVFVWWIPQREALGSSGVVKIKARLFSVVWAQQVLPGSVTLKKPGGANVTLCIHTM